MQTLPPGGALCKQRQQAYLLCRAKGCLHLIGESVNTKLSTLSIKLSLSINIEDLIPLKNTSDHIKACLPLSSSLLLALPLRLDSPVLALRDLPSAGVPGVTGTLVARQRPGTNSSRSWQPTSLTSSQPAWTANTGSTLALLIVNSIIQNTGTLQ